MRRRKSPPGPSPLLVVGLRNPGSDYEGTRHNLGGEVVTAFHTGAAFKRAPKRILAEIAEERLYDARIVLALPMTYMNQSGGPVAALTKYFRVAEDRLVIVHDDIDLPFGKLRFQGGRGAGGHNGVASVVRSLGSQEIWRLKLGVGRPPGRMDPADFVLRRFANAERSDVDLMVAAGADVLRSFVMHGSDAARQEAGDATARLGIAK
jgi:PTH1 family peptidyl-tRNA hydrolase